MIYLDREADPTGSDRFDSGNINQESAWIFCCDIAEATDDPGETLSKVH
jgi:hypothetical protein